MTFFDKYEIMVMCIGMPFCNLLTENCAGHFKSCDFDVRGGRKQPEQGCIYI